MNTFRDLQSDQSPAASAQALSLAYQQALKYGEDFRHIYCVEQAHRRELKQERHLLDTIVSRIPDGVVVLDESFIIQRANQEFASLVMAAPEALVGRAIIDVLLADGLSTFLDAIRRNPDFSDPYEVSIVRPVQKDGKAETLVFKRRSFLLNAARLKDVEGGGWVLVVHDQTQQKLLDEALDRYVSPEAADSLIQHGARLGGEVVAGSVLFADIRDFTSLAESLSSTEVVGLLNHYYAAVEPIVREEGGWIARFGGDSLLAVFGVPTFQPDHAYRAVQTAARIQAAVADFNLQQRLMGAPRLRVGIGVACGEMVAGNIGSPDRMEYTVIGDTVNLASRIEEMTKEWQVDILVSEPVFNQVEDCVDATLMPVVTIRGREKPVRLYGLRRVGGQPSSRGGELERVLSRH